MSGKLEHEEPVMSDTTVSSDGSASDNEYSKIGSDTSGSESLEISGDERNLRKESEDLFGSNESGSKDTDSETLLISHPQDTTVNSSFEDGTVEDVFEDEEVESNSFSSEDEDTADSLETSLSPNADVEYNSAEKYPVEGIFDTEARQSEVKNGFKVSETKDAKLRKALKNDCDESSSLNNSTTSSSDESEHGEIKNELKSSGSMADAIVNKSSTEVLEIDSDASNSLEKPSANVLSDRGENDKVSNQSESSNEAKDVVAVRSKSPELPTEALKSLSISESPNTSGNKNTPRQSRSRPRTINNIFDSPYNTRLKARLIREREMRSRSEGGSTEE